MKLLALIILASLVLPVAACNDCCENPAINNTVSVRNFVTQVQWMSQQQSQQQEQHQEVNVASGTQSSWISDSGEVKNVGSIVQEGKTYSRLLYPNEVITVPVQPGQTCTLLSGLPVSFYTINTGHGYFENQVQTLESIPLYDPIYHRMEFGMTPVVDKIDYWTMKARLQATTNADFCVVDNRAVFNGYTTIEVTVR